MTEKHRRRILKSLAVTLPAVWTPPLVRSVVLPAHAQTSSLPLTCKEIARADGYYWRWTGASGYECGNDGYDYLFPDAQSYEYNLPASGAVIKQYEIDNGVTSYIGDITGLSGSGSGTETVSATHYGTDPYGYAYQRDLVIDGVVRYRSTLTYACMTDAKTFVTTVGFTIVNEICPSH